MNTTAITTIAKAIKLLILDVDGVLTNGELFFFEGGEYKAFNSRDGMGLAMLLRAGVQIAIISGSRSVSVEQRLQKFGINNIYQGVEDKGLVYHAIKEEMQLSNDEVAYMGDDLIDLPIMTQVGLATAVADADDFVKTKALWISQHKGGRGAVRELAELILSAKGLLTQYRQEYCR